MAGTPTNTKKSGIRAFKPSEVVFRENDPAESLFIIQKGQIRLYRPKGKGFVDLAILRSGEVIGEMAFFDDKAGRRSCSAEAMVNTEVIEISFQAFAKTMENLNPWFKTIINTLADRLRKTNERVKSLEGNSVGFGQGGKAADYKFFHNIDIIRLLSTCYLVAKSSGQKKGEKYQVHVDTLKFYILDVFNIAEVKYEEFLNLLIKNGFAQLLNDMEGRPKLLEFNDLESLKLIMNFINSQRMLEDEKKLNISHNCEIFLGRILKQLNGKSVQEKMTADISSILTDFEIEKVPISDQDLAEAVSAGLCEDIVVGEANKCTAVIHFEKLSKVFPCIQMVNLINKINQLKAEQK